MNRNEIPVPGLIMVMNVADVIVAYRTYLINLQYRNLELLFFCECWWPYFLYKPRSVCFWYILNFLCRCVLVEATVTRKIGSIADYDPGATSSLNSAYQPVGVGMRQRQEWEETVPISSSTPCTCRLALDDAYT